MTYSEANELLEGRQKLCLPMPTLALAPAVWYLGAHMLKCVLEASDNLKTGTVQRHRTPVQQTTADKSTQTIASSFKKTRGKTPVKGTRREVSRAVCVDEPKKSARGRRKSISESKACAPVSKPQVAKRQPSVESKSTKTEIAEGRRSKTPTNSAISQPTKGGTTTRSRRGSTGDCPKRTSGSLIDVDTANWLKNPVYNSDGESDGRRTDRSDMSPPWFDISIAQKETKKEEHGKRVSSSSAISLASSTAKHAPIRVRHTPRMEVVPEGGRDVNLRKPPNACEAASSAPRVLSATDLAIRQIIDRKLGRPYKEMDPSALKAISEKRMKELAEKYAGSRPKINLADREIPAPYASRNHPRALGAAAANMLGQPRE